MTTYQINSGTPSGAGEASVIVNRSGTEVAGAAGVRTDGTVYTAGFDGGCMVHSAHVDEQEQAVHEAIRATITDGRPRSLSFGTPRGHERAAQAEVH